MAMSSPATERFLPDEVATLAFGAELAKTHRQGVIYLIGELGAGKTTLVRGYLRELGYAGAVKSPTYTLVEPYNIQQRSIAHLDLYRVNDPRELTFAGIDEAIEEADIVFVEWPNKGEGVLPEADIKIDLLVAKSGRYVSMK